MNNKKIKFVRQDLRKVKRLKDVWRKPKGLHSKQRLQLNKRPPIVKIGYKRKKNIRFLHPSKTYPTVIYSKSCFEKIKDKKNIGVYLSSKLGLKKKKELTKLCVDAKIKIYNPRYEK